MNPTSRRVAVIGGGYAGFAAAVELSRHGVPVVLFEAARTLGGRARRVETAGARVDNGLHILIGAYTETLRLIDCVRQPGEPAGLLRRQLELTIHPRFHLRAPRLRAPLHLAAALLCCKGIAFSDRLRAAGFMAKLRRQHFQLVHDITVADLLKAHRQSGSICRFLWYPLCVSALNTPPEQASAQVFLNVLRDSLNGSRADSDLMLPQTDFSALFPEPAARFLRQRGGDVRTGVRVDSFSRSADGFGLAPGAGRFSEVIIAVSPHRAGSLLAAHPELADTIAMLDALTYQPIYSVYLQYPPGTRLPFRMGGIEAEYSQWLFDRGQLCGQDGLIGVVISASGAHQDLDQEELALKVRDELAQALGITAPALWHKVIAEKRATFACTPGLRRPGTRTAIPGLFLAGDYVRSDYPATIEAAVRSGIEAARQVMQHA
jgi:hydroxysqualene dehydroxylase